METAETEKAGGQSEAAGSGKLIKIKIPRKETILTAVALILLMALAMQVRLTGFYKEDGTPRWPYLRNIDSYAYFADVENMLEGTGSFAIGSRLYQHVTYWGYRLFVGSAVTDESLTQFLIWWPAFLIALAVMPAYLLGRYLYDRKAGVLSAFFVVMAPTIASRTLAGDPDSDVMVILMAILSLGLFALALRKFDASKPLGRKSIFYPALSGVGIALFALTWPGYWFVFFVVLGTILGKIVITAVQFRLEKRQSSETKGFAKSWLLHLAFFLVAFWAITLPLLGTQFILNPFSQIGLSAELFGGGGIKSEEGDFPNVYVSVAELQRGGQTWDVVNRAIGFDFGAPATGIDSSILGIISPLILSVFAFAYLIYSYYKRREHLDTLLLLGLWMLGMLYSSVSAVRFGIFLAPVFAVAAAIGLSKLWNIAFSREEVST